MERLTKTSPGTDLKAEVDRARAVLREILELSGLSHKALSRRLEEHGCSGTNLSRLFTGKAALRLEHIIAISRALVFHPLEFFHIVFEQPEQRSPFLHRLWDLIAPHGRQPIQHGPAVARDEFDKLRRQVAGLARQVEQLVPEGQRQPSAERRVSHHPPSLASPIARRSAENSARTAQGLER
jgi:hypothetical protein